MKKYGSKRKGFTLIEVILAIVVVAVIMGIVIPKVMSNSDKAQIKQVISSDVRSIISAAADWKRTDRTDANGVYDNISAELLSSRLPSNMDVDEANKYIKSSGFNGGCIFTLDSNGSSAFKMGMDCTTAATKLSWSSKLKAYAREAFIDTIKSLSTSADKLESGSIGDGTSVDCSASNKNAACAQGITQ